MTSSKNTNFRNDLSLSTNDCLRLLDYLRARGCTVEDKQDDMHAQAQGYDFLLDGQKCEFKSDRYIAKTQNIAFELKSNVEKDTPGAALTSQADYWFYMEQGSNIVHVFSFPRLKQFVLSLNLEAYKKTYPTTQCGKDKSYQTECVLIPLGFIMRVPNIGYRRLDLSFL